jgi:biopolymer transport protein ExbD
MSLAVAPSPRGPLSEINATPLIDVLLVLLIVLIMAVPLATDSLEIELPQTGPVKTTEPDPVRNLLAIETDGTLVWNGRAIDERELAAQLARVRAMNPEPEVQFRPDAEASYERSAQALLIVKRSRIGNFGFVENERYRTFGKP